MRFAVAQWAPEYGVPTEVSVAEASATVECGVEVPSPGWRGIVPQVEPVIDVLFVDGVRRVDASLWIGDSPPVPGLAATYAAGAVKVGAGAEMVGARVERGCFTAAGEAGDVVTAAGTYRVRPVAGGTVEELWLGIQQRMRELEGVVAAAHAKEGELVVLDGPLSHRRAVPGAVGYVKRAQVEYLPSDLVAVKWGLEVGERTPVFLITTSWSRFSWYLRLAAADSPAEGVVRCEVDADIGAVAAARLADRVTATLPRFASSPYKDPRAPANLYPIAGLERELRRRLGDQQLMYRALRRAARGR